MNYPILITSKANVYYFTGLDSSNACLVLYKDYAVLVTDFRYKEAAKKTGYNLAIIGPGQTMEDVVLDILSSFGSEIVAYEDYDLVAKKFLVYAEKFQMLPVDEKFLKVRAIKEQNEAEKMLMASNIAIEAYNKAFEKIEEGITERQVVALIDYNMKALGASDVSFETIVAFGKNSSMPHHKPSNAKLQKGDAVLIDMGAKYEGYCSDMTRTFFYGEPSDKQKEIYEIVLEAQQKALDAVKSGIKCSELDAVARNYIEEKGYGNCFGHGLGHGVGVEIHEAPRVAGSSTDVLEAGMVITIEPGIYIENEFGVRIEDMVLVTADGCINLTNLNKKLINK